MSRRILALTLSLLLIFSSTLVGLSQTQFTAGKQLVEKSYLELLEMDTIPKLSEEQTKAVEEQLKSENKSEQERLKQREQQVENEIKSLRDRLKSSIHARLGTRKK